MKNKTLLIMLLCVLIFPFVSSSFQTLYVNSTSNYITIQSAINNASNGDSVVVDSGIYNENLVINKSITLLGAQNGIDAKIRNGWDNESTISSSYSDGTIQVQADNVLIDGFKINNTFKGIHVTVDSSNLTVINNIVLGPMNDGINLWRASSAYIENNFVSGANVSGITAGDDRGTLDKSDDLATRATIKKNIVENSRYGITGYQKNSIIEENAVRDYFLGQGAGIGGQFIGADIKNNSVKGYSSGAGFALAYNGDFPNRFNSSYIQFENNILTNNYAGIYINQTVLGKEINISYNNIFGNINSAINTNTDSWESLNAEYNYWGSCQGPLPGNITGYVNYDPWIGACVKNQTISDNCIIENESITLNAEILGYCISDVIFSVSKDSNWTNYSSSSHTGNNYSLNLADLSSSYFEWKVYTTDCLNNVNESLIKYFYIYPGTKLTIAPLEPDGKNGWYITNPIFILTNPNASHIYYKWDSMKIFLYSTFFGFENAPNNQNITGGVIDLNYWSNLSCNKNESVNFIFIKSDFTNPKIEPLYPKENTLVNDLRPEISVYLDEIYGSNSGINTSSIILKLNEEIVVPNITRNNLDATIKYTPDLNLSEEKNNLSVYVEDNSGRFSEKSWSFNVKFVNKSFSLNVNSPNLVIYRTSNIPFNITTDKKVSLIEYRDSGSNGRWLKLCTNCNNYGNSSKKTKMLTEGQHNLTIRASNEFETHEKNISFIVDSKIPKIYKIEPKANQFTDGSNFYIKFLEKNPSELLLFINNSLNEYQINLSNCTMEGVYTDCYYKVNLTSFEGKTIPYWFELKDIANHTSLIKKTLVKVDTQNPYMNITSPQDNANYTNHQVLFLIFVNETNLNSVSYNYTYNGKEREVLLCSRLNKNSICKITKSFASGNYTIFVKAEDKAGNAKEEPVSFEVK